MSVERARDDSPALADLAVHEAVIERGLSTFVEVGIALVTIRDGKKYQAAGYDTFELYCRNRWGFSRQQGLRLMQAAETAQLMTPMGVIATPTTERQLRPLSKLRAVPEEMREAWAEAVEESGGKPTARQVEAVVTRRLARDVSPEEDAERREREHLAAKVEAGRQFDCTLGNVLFELSVLAEHPEHIASIAANWHPMAAQLTVADLRSARRTLDLLIKKWGRK